MSSSGLGRLRGGYARDLPRVDLPMHELSVLAVGETRKYFESERPWNVLKDNARIDSTLKI